MSDVPPLDMTPCAGCGCTSSGVTVGCVDCERRELVNALADCVVKAAEYGTQDDGFVAFYVSPTGPIHRAIPLLERHGVIVRPGFDGRDAS